ncbi:hypothetical protein D917_03392 [Trichinella nativa]|uniref:Uncharacterized protein n=1 Tax=Trichinella nativa TaxID=6335 RepID=A0A1Y3EE30_9BILA|nr:hypothetical protein D917_03392 [Trichinella nativa]
MRNRICCNSTLSLSVIPEQRAAIGSGKLTMPQPLPVMCTPESRRIPSHPTATYSASAQLFTSSTPTSSSSKLAYICLFFYLYVYWGGGMI